MPPKKNPDEVFSAINQLISCPLPAPTDLVETAKLLSAENAKVYLRQSWSTFIA